MLSFLPPATDELRSRIVARNARRARVLGELLGSRLRKAALSRESLRSRRAILALLERVLASARGETRERLLYAPGMRAWLGLAEDGLALTDPARSPLDLFDRVSIGPYLQRLMPRWRLDRDFPRRAVHLGREMLERCFLRLPPLLVFLLPPGRRFGPFPLDLEADAEEARLRGEVHISTPAPVTLYLARGAVIELVGPRVSQDGIGASLRVLSRGRVRWTEPTSVPHSGIVIRRRVRWTRRGAVPGPHVRGAARRLGDALALLDEAWPEAGREVRAQTFEVVPLVERGTVSYSLPSRPGVSFINLHGKSVIDLADDLLHESAHHRLHGLEEIEGPLDRDDGEPRYWSPWRRSIRPVHGILHAAYTFTWRAALLTRLLAIGRELPRDWIRKQRGTELEMLEQAVGSLRDARRRGLLTNTGSEIVRSIARRLHGMV